MEEYETPMEDQSETDESDDSDAEMLAGGDFIRPGVSAEAREFVARARELMYNEKFTPILKQAIAGGQDLVSGAAPVIAQIILQVENKMGPLSDDDLQDVAISLAGTIAGFAKMLEHPDAENIAETAHEIAEGAIEIMNHQEEQAPEEGEQMPPDAQEPQAPPQTMQAMQ